MRKRAFSVIALLMVVVFVFVSGGFTSAASAAKDTNKIIAAADPGKLPAAAKSREDTLIAGSSSWNGEFNPVFASSVYDAWAVSLIFDTFGLMGNDDNGNPKLWMAKDYSVSKDGKTYTFTINKGIKFSNGDPVTAQDFALIYIAIADPKYDGARTDAAENLVGYEEYHKGYAKTLKGVKVVDDNTIQFTEKTIKASALLQDFAYQPIDHKLYSFTKGNVAGLKKLYSKAIGAGPYKLVENKPSQYITFEKNDSYWKGAPKIDKVIMKYVTSANQIQELSTGGVDIDGTVPCKPQNIDMLTGTGFINQHLYPANQYGYIGLNLRDPKFSDKRVRQALTYGLNRAGFVKAYYKDYAEVCNAPVSIVSWAYTDKVNQYPYDPKKAAELLDAAGWKLDKDGFRYKDGKKFTISWMTYTGSAYVETLVPIVKENWKALGIEVVPELMEFATLSDKVYKTRKFDIYNMAWSLSIDPDPSGIFAKSQDVVGGFNSVGWVDPRSETLIRAGLKETNQAKRVEIYQQWCQLANEELPYIFLNQGDGLYAVSSRVKGFHAGPYRDWTYDIQNLELGN
jgi:peptide/nickel transport system substrate-binding protein